MDSWFKILTSLAALLSIANTVWLFCGRWWPPSITVPSHTTDSTNHGRISVVIRNHRTRPIRVVAIRIQAFNNKTKQWICLSPDRNADLQLPRIILDEDRFDIGFSAWTTFAANVLSPFYVEVETALGKTFRSRKLTYKGIKR
jgi:hypothetical protein